MTKSKKKMGRPKLPANETRGVFSVRFSPDERKQIASAAKQAGEPLTKWARNALLATAAQNRQP